ncbi:putative high-affinity branched-chain amino acid ABC transporter, permease protein [Paenibacillus terrae HPL-003]|uniref:Putative high-affinity branched-chain amino acid ABC transporter, permease protein n=1 Tax=Paenibacillus terrae (strain HPL-003) TaxID=985665 RepID=G7VUD4_PAETH|nr:branched-chain amino acid ABC transporter permease [Paenibacillus terrae]AET56931.1 putative high-affinity branched-chain amino acid ABC transporter, permease protein [Paenibacillus terrae HPL-003]
MKLKNYSKLLAGVLLLTLPLFLQQMNDYVLHIAITVGIYIILSLSLNIIIGYAGQFALGHAAFYGIGAYASALLMLHWNVSFWVALPAAAIITGLFGLLLGSPVIRLRGDYLGIVTLGFGEIVRLVFVNWVDVTRGPMGLPGIPAPTLFGYTFTEKTDFYYLILVLAAITIFVVHRIIHSGIGLNLLTIREDETLAQSIGIRPVKYKLMAFALGAFFAGVAGAFWASYISYISPDGFRYMDSVNILAMVILGGAASIPGSILGAVILVLAPELLRYVNDYRMMLMGVAIVLMMIFKPSGFWGEKHRKTNFYRLQRGERKP